MAEISQDVASQIKPELEKQFLSLQQGFIDAISEKMEPLCDMLAQMAELRQENAEMHRRTLEALTDPVKKCMDPTDVAGSGEVEKPQQGNANSEAPAETSMRQVQTEPKVAHQYGTEVRAGRFSMDNSVRGMEAAGFRIVTEKCGESLTGILPAGPPPDLHLEEVEEMNTTDNLAPLAISGPQARPLRKSFTSPHFVNIHEIPPPPYEGDLAAPGEEPEILDLTDDSSSPAQKLPKLQHSQSAPFSGQESMNLNEDRFKVSVHEFHVKNEDSSIHHAVRDAAARFHRQQQVECAMARNRGSVPMVNGDVVQKTGSHDKSAKGWKKQETTQEMERSNGRGSRTLKNGFSFTWFKAQRSLANMTGVWSDWDEDEADQKMQERYGLHANRVVFADADAIKEKLRQAIVRPKYDVANFYWETGWCQLIARNAYFETLTLFVIALNAVWIAVDTECNKAEMLHQADPIFQIAENCFAVYFTCEWTVRFFSFRDKRKCVRDGWFVFDSLLVVVMILETWVMTVILLTISKGGDGANFADTSVMRLLRLLRLTRMARMAKLLVAMPELHILIKGLLLACRSVFFTLVFLLVIVYIFAIAFTQLLVDTDTGRTYFRTVPDSMLTLLVHCTFMDGFQLVVRAVGSESFFHGFVLFLFVLLVSLSLMNMLIGILCEVVTVVSAMEKENAMLTFVKEKMQSMLVNSGLDNDGDGIITKDEFERLLDIPEAARALQEVGVDVVGLVDFADFIFGLNGDIPLTFPDFMDVVLQLRGSNNATVKDMVDMRKFITQEMSCLEEALHKNIASTIRKTQQCREPSHRQKSTRNNTSLDPNRLTMNRTDSDASTYRKEEQRNFKSEAEWSTSDHVPGVCPVVVETKLGLPPIRPFR